MSDTNESQASATEFATAGRASESEIRKSLRTIESSELLKGTLNSLQEIILILNAQRQIVYANSSLFAKLGLDKAVDICGLRPGELLKCSHSENATGGCGTSCYCKVCGAVNAIVESQMTGQKVSKECQMLLNDGKDALTLMTSATPLKMGDETFTVLAISDISEAKMKAILERMFLHDALNLAGGIKGLAEILKDEPPDPRTASVAGIIYNATLALIDEIKAQRELMLAEKGELTSHSAKLSSLDIIKATSSFYRKHDVADGKGVSLKKESEDVEFESDPVLVNRVLGNMLKNALEAVPKGGIVSIGCFKAQEPWKLEFRVFNPGCMPEEVQLNMFHRAFSTKGQGRGLGTYGMKLIGERYLGGSVSFISNEQEGTTFFFRLK